MLDISPDFSPLSALLGGIFIGSAASLFWLLHGRIMGITGLLSGLFMRVPNTDNLIFFAGALSALPILSFMNYERSITLTTSVIPLVILSGLLAGFGASLGSGCTSGHGVCGLSRLSKRSIAATGVFMISAIATVYILRHQIG